MQALNEMYRSTLLRTPKMSLIVRGVCTIFNVGTTLLSTLYDVCTYLLYLPK